MATRSITSETPLIPGFSPSQTRQQPQPVDLVTGLVTKIYLKTYESTDPSGEIQKGIKDLLTQPALQDQVKALSQSIDGSTISEAKIIKNYSKFNKIINTVLVAFYHLGTSLGAHIQQLKAANAPEKSNPSIEKALLEIISQNVKKAGVDLDATTKNQLIDLIRFELGKMDHSELRGVKKMIETIFTSAQPIHLMIRTNFKETRPVSNPIASSNNECGEFFRTVLDTIIIGAVTYLIASKFLA